MYQTIKTVFDHVSKYLKVRQKCSAKRRIYSSLLGVWKPSFGFDFNIKFIPALPKPKGKRKNSYIPVDQTSLHIPPPPLILEEPCSIYPYFFALCLRTCKPVDDSAYKSVDDLILIKYLIPCQTKI